MTDLIGFHWEQKEGLDYGDIGPFEHEGGGPAHDVGVEGEEVDAEVQVPLLRHAPDSRPVAAAVVCNGPHTVQLQWSMTVQVQWGMNSAVTMSAQLLTG